MDGLLARLISWTKMVMLICLFVVVNTFKKLQCGAVPPHRHDIFYEVLKSYVGNKWQVAPFLKLIQGAIWEIVNGYYTEDDKRALFDTLCELEREAIELYYTNWRTFPSFGISLKHQMYRCEGLLKSGYVQTIKVPLREYRAMQYVLSSSIKP